MKNLMELPTNLPVPQDDGACDHLIGTTLPAIKLKTTDDRTIDFGDYKKPCVIFFYPRTGEPDKPTPENWDLIPGARGCTPQSCGYRDLYAEFKELGFEIFGASTQSTDYQKEFVKRMHIPFEILSDEHYELTNGLKLPTFDFNGAKLIKRLALVIENAKIIKSFYPVFPPNENANTVLSWLKNYRKKTLSKKDFYFAEENWLASYVEKDWYDHIAAETKNPNEEFHFHNFDSNLLYSDYHEQLVDVVKNEIEKQTTKPVTLLEIGSSLGRTFYEVCKKIGSIENATLVEPSELLSSHFVKIFNGTGNVVLPVLKGNFELRQISLNNNSIKAATSKVNYSLLTLPFEQLNISEKFDLVICSNVIDQIDDPLDLVELLKNRTSNGGVVALSCTYLWKRKIYHEQIKDVRNLFGDDWKILNETNISFKCRRNERYWMHFISHAIILKKSNHPST